MLFENWTRGGPATVYIVLDSTLMDFEKETWPKIKNSVLGITAISSEAVQLSCARKLVETIARYLKANGEENARVLKMLHAPIRNEEGAPEIRTVC